MQQLGPSTHGQGSTPARDTITFVVIDAEGGRLMSRRVANDEPEVEAAITAVLNPAYEVT